MGLLVEMSNELTHRKEEHHHEHFLHGSFLQAAHIAKGNRVVFFKKGKGQEVDRFNTVGVSNCDTGM